MTTPHKETLWIAKYDPELDVDPSSIRYSRTFYDVDTLASAEILSWRFLPLKARNKRRGWRVVKVKVEEVK